MWLSHYTWSESDPDPALAPADPPRYAISLDCVRWRLPGKGGFGDA